MMRRTWMRGTILPLLATVLLLAGGCGDLGDDPVSPGNTTPPAVTTWEDDVVPNVITPLGCIGCHSASTPNGGLDLTDFSSWIDATSNTLGNPYVVAGDPDQSELSWRLQGSNGAPVMPPSGGASQEMINTLNDWIADGALETAPAE